MAFEVKFYEVKESASDPRGTVDGLLLGESREDFRSRVHERFLCRATAPRATLGAIDDSDISQHLQTLAMLTIENRLRIVVELGVRTGASTSVLLDAAAKIGGHVTSVDTDPCERAKRSVRSLRLDRLWMFLHGDDTHPEILSRIPRPIDHLFIDTSHFYRHTLVELDLYLPLVRHYGFITIHDTEMAGVMRAITETLEANPSFRFYNYFNNHGLAVIRKVPPRPEAQTPLV